MTDDVIRVECETTLDEFVDDCMRQAQRLKPYPRPRPRWLILGGPVGGPVGGVVGGVVGVIFAAGLFGRAVGAEVFVGAVLGGFVGSLLGPLYERRYERSYETMVIRLMRASFVEQFADRMPMRCVIELRPACLWYGQEGVETAYDWTTVTAVEDRADGVDIWLDRGLIVARNRAFATPSDRERFVNRLRASAPATQHAT